MPDATSSTNDCPLCGEPYDQQIVVEQGMRWEDLFPGTPLDFFKRYERRCTSRYDAEEDDQLPERKRAVYFHTGHTHRPFN